MLIGALRDFLEISWFFGRYEVFLCEFMLFGVQFSCEGAVTSFAYETSACLALMRFLDEISYMFAFFGLFEYFAQGPSAFISCALTVN
jgi:hypothetical protein